MAQSPSTDTLNYKVFDTMTSSVFAGNPTPVFILDHLDDWLPDSAMQAIASEMQQPDTCFIRKVLPSGRDGHAIRWFTPFAEEPFCGHAVLAAAIALFQEYGIKDCKFESPGGIMTRTHLSGNYEGDRATRGPFTVIVDFPLSPATHDLSSDDSLKKRFAIVLGIEPRMILHIAKNALMDILLDIDPAVNFSAARKKIDAASLLEASPPKTRNQILTSISHDDGVDFVKRVFAYGREDDATGSSYCSLGPYWAQNLNLSTLRARQLSPRGGYAELTMHQGSDVVKIKAQGIQSMTGEIVMPSKSFKRAESTEISS